jgi:hypothetical protein
VNDVTSFLQEIDRNSPLRGARLTSRHSSATACDEAVISHSEPGSPFLLHRPNEGSGKAKQKDSNMKRIVLASALVAASAFGAVAQTAPAQLSSAIQSQILTVLPGADLSNLSNSQYAQIVSLFADSENLRTPSDISGAVGAILGAQ